MLHKFTPHLPRYFSKHVSHSFRSLVWSVGMMNFALAAFLIFEPIYLFSLGYTLAQVLLFYLGVYVVYALILPFASRILAKIGVEHSIFYSQFFLIGYLLALYGISHVPLLIFPAVLLLALQKLFYWPAFHIDFMSFSDQSQRGREMSSLMSVSSVMMILGPFVGGFVIPALFLIDSALFLLSTIPLLHLHEMRTTEHESYRSVVNHLRQPERRKDLGTFFGFGEELIVMVAWPIFIYVIIGDLSTIGSLVASATLVSTLLLLVIGKKTDSSARPILARTGIYGYIGIWVLRSLARIPAAVVIVDAISQLTKNMLFVPMSTGIYERASRTLPVSYVVFFEQALSIGKIVAAVLVILLTFIFTDPWWPIFILGALFTFFYLRSHYAHPTSRSTLRA